MKKNAINFVNTILSSIEENDFETAMFLILENQEKYAEYVPFLKAQASLCIKVAELKTAIALLKKAQILDPLDGEIYSQLCLAYEKKACEEENIIQFDSDDREGIKYTEELNLYKIREAIGELRARKTAPLVSVFLLAYNNLEKFTRPSVDALLKYTKNIDCELILIDNGSTDGTFEYFKQIKFERKKIIRISKNVGAFYGQLKARQYCDGKFIAGIPNDVIVTENWLKNMLCCMQSDERIGIVVPMSDYCSNCQQVDLKYADFEDMQKKAAIFNLPDKKKWEERLRVIPTAFLIRREVWNLYANDDAFIYNFSDDDLSFQFRRAGYKLIVCGDVFVHHEGSTVEGSNQDRYNNDLKIGKTVFREKYYGIDAWEDVLNLEQLLIELIPLYKDNKIPSNILGIDIRCGSPLLTLKNKLRKYDIYDTKLFAFSSEAKYWLDLKSICNGEVVCDRVEYLNEHFHNIDFQYIVLGEYINSYEKPMFVLKELLYKLKKQGFLALKVRNKYDFDFFESAIARNELDIDIDIDIDIDNVFLKLGFKIVNQLKIVYTMEDSLKEEFLKKVKRLKINGDKTRVLEEVFVFEKQLVVQNII